MNARHGWIEISAEVSVKRQCILLEVNRSRLYYKPVAPSAQAQEEEVMLCQLIETVWQLHPYFGTRRMTQHLRTKGYVINRKRVQRLMTKLGLRGMAPGPDTSKQHPEHKKYPYLLRGVEVVRPNQVWSTDITYIRMGGGFVYLVAIIDWYARRVLSWRVSNTIDSTFCIECLEGALSLYGTPEIFNSDQGSQFTSTAFTAVLQREGVRISMDGRGRALDNVYIERLWRSVKYEDIFLRGYENMGELMVGLTRYFTFYNQERQHQSLSYHTPDEVYRTGQHGGAYIPDKFRTTVNDVENTGNTPQTAQPCLVVNNEMSIS